MKYEIETNHRDFLLAKAIRNEMARKWEESLQMASSPFSVKSRNEVYWEKEIDQLADFQLQIISQHKRRWQGADLYGTW